jgi:hypothetical protein
MGRWRHEASKSKTLYFVRKPSWRISEQPGEFCIEQAQKIIGGSKSAPWRCGLFIFLEMQGQPSHRMPTSTAMHRTPTANRPSSGKHEDVGPRVRVRVIYLALFFFLPRAWPGPKALRRAGCDVCVRAVCSCSTLLCSV